MHMNVDGHNHIQFSLRHGHDLHSLHCSASVLLYKAGMGEEDDGWTWSKSSGLNIDSRWANTAQQCEAYPQRNEKEWEKKERNGSMHQGPSPLGQGMRTIPI